MQEQLVQAYWQESEKELLKLLKTSEKGLAEEEADRRLRKFGKNEFVRNMRTPLALRFLLKFKNPLVLILLLASLISAFLGELSNLND